MKILETKNLILRSWQSVDAHAYFELNQDPKVTECLPRAITFEESEKFIVAQNLQLKQREYCLFACELKATNELMGFVGLNYTEWKENPADNNCPKNFAPLPAFIPAVEIGWRLASKFWGHGYATEAARAVLNHFLNNDVPTIPNNKIPITSTNKPLAEIISFTVPANMRSIRVMEKIGMKCDLSGDFSHPKLPLNHPLSQHVLYRISASNF
jgi:RimJ/RimL family protein N-acetyltransferase